MKKNIFDRLLYKLAGKIAQKMKEIQRKMKERLRKEQEMTEQVRNEKEYNRIHFEINNELHELNIKMDKFYYFLEHNDSLSKKGTKIVKRSRSSRKKYGLTRQQSSAMRIALQKARNKGYKDYSPAMRRMISSAIQRAK